MLGQRVRFLFGFLIRDPVVTDFDRAASSLLSRLEQKKQERWEVAVNSIDSRTLAARHGEPSTNLLAGLDAPLACVPRLGKLHCLATCEERGTHDMGARVHQAGQQGAVRPMEDTNT